MEPFAAADKSRTTLYPSGGSPGRMMKCARLLGDPVHAISATQQLSDDWGVWFNRCARHRGSTSLSVCDPLPLCVCWWNVHTCSECRHIDTQKNMTKIERASVRAQSRSHRKSTARTRQVQWHGSRRVRARSLLRKCTVRTYDEHFSGADTLHAAVPGNARFYKSS